MKSLFSKIHVFFALVLGLIVVCGVSPMARAQPAPVPCGSIFVTLPDSGGVNYCELNPATGGFWSTCVKGKGFYCCQPQFPLRITERLFADYRRSFIMSSFYRDKVQVSFKMIADEFRNTAVMRVAAIGAFMDASIFNDTLKDMGVYATESLQSYTPSDQICKFGTLSKALAASEARMDLDRMVMSEAGLAKNLGTTNSISAAGRGMEFQMRLKSFVDSFCALEDNADGLGKLCQVATPVDDYKQNRDVDYTRLMGTAVTINADLTDSNGTQDELNMFAIAHNLYGHRQPSKRFSYDELLSNPDSQIQYSEYRSVAARRAAAQNTYNTLAAMKMAGSGGSDTYIRDVLNNLGLSGEAADKYLGAKDANGKMVKSSYDAQMNLLTKQIYQDPSFYANLMDSKVNVKRTSASLQGFGLMQARDTYKSMARSEMLMAILVQLEARKIANNINGVKE